MDVDNLIIDHVCLDVLCNCLITQLGVENVIYHDGVWPCYYRN